MKKKRKSKYCLKWCDGKGCYDTWEKRLLGGVPTWTWVIHCKELEKINKKVLGKF